jgi:hypothetical protein
MDESCRFKYKFCFVDKKTPPRHYQLLPIHFDSWANSVRDGTATLEEPPYRLYRALVEAESNGANQPIKQAKSTEGSGGDMNQMITSYMGVMTASAMQSMAENQQRIQERIERREAAEGADIAPTVRPASTFDAGAASRRSPPDSSPICRRADDSDIIEAFFEWRLSKLKNAVAISLWTETRDIVQRCGWRVRDLQKMDRSDSEMFKEGVDEGIKPAVARSLRDYLHEFKAWDRENRETAS